MAKALVWCALLFSPAVSTEKADTRIAVQAVRCAPERVFALRLRDAAVVAWVLPQTCQDSASITSYTISAFDDDAPLMLASTAEADEAGAEVRGLAPGHCYTFSVHAGNSAGRGPESERSEEICLPSPGADIELTMTAPATSTPGEELTFTMRVTNHGAADAALVSIVDTLPAPLATYTTTQGVCHGAMGGMSFGCNVGALYSGASATVTVTVVTGNTSMTNTAWATAYDDAGVALVDREPKNNSATATVSVQAP